MNIEELNTEYKNLSKGVFPFISKNKITVLETGYYDKFKANYKGLSYYYDKFDNTYKTLLLGYIHVPYNLVIVPEEAIVNEIDSDIIKLCREQHYKILNKFPSIKPINFAYDTREYKIAKSAYDEYKNK